METDNPFWRFSLKSYAHSAVREICIRLQDAFSANVNLLLFWTWIGAERQSLATPEAIAESRALVSGWSGNVVQPLRSVRSWIKVNAEEEAARLIREQVKDIELRSEQFEQAMLFEWAERGLKLDQGPDAASSNVRLFLSAHGADEAWLEAKSALIGR